MISEILFLLLALPVGLLLAHLASDELKQGRKYFRILMIASVVLGAWFFLIGEIYLTWTFAFILIVASVGFVESRKG